LLRAGYKEKDHFFNHQMIHLKPGQFIIGREQGSKDLRFSPKTFDRKIHDLQIMEIVTRSSTHRFSIISIINWDAYQNRSEKDDPLNGTNVHGTCTEPDHKQEVKNEKKIKERRNTPPPPSRGESPSPSKEVADFDWGKWNAELDLYPPSEGGNNYSDDSDGWEYCDPKVETERTYDLLIAGWNQCCSDPYGLPRVTTSTEKLVNLFKAKVKEWGGYRNLRARWTMVLAWIVKNPFLQKENDEGWKVSLEWILSDDNLEKILRGDFTDAQSLKSKTSLTPALVQAKESQLDLLSASPSGHEKQIPKGITEPAEKPGTPGEEFQDKDPLPPEIPTEEALPAESRREISKKGVSELLKSLDEKRPAEGPSPSPAPDNGDEHQGIGTLEEPEESCPRNADGEDSGEGIAQAFGFRPERISEASKTHREFANIEANFRNCRDDLHARFRLAKDADERKKVILDIQRYNLSVMKYRGAVPMINAQSLSEETFF
jgi:hypothetical protein